MPNRNTTAAELVNKSMAAEICQRVPATIDRWEADGLITRVDRPGAWYRLDDVTEIFESMAAGGHRGKRRDTGGD